MILRAAPDGFTGVAGVIGDPVAHSLSPSLHNAAYEAAGINWTYVAFHVRRGQAAQAVNAMRNLGIRGLSVTMPHKEAVVDAADIVTPAVRTLMVGSLPTTPTVTALLTAMNGTATRLRGSRLPSLELVVRRVRSSRPAGAPAPRRSW